MSKKACFRHWKIRMCQRASKNFANIGIWFRYLRATKQRCHPIYVLCKPLTIIWRCCVSWEVSIKRKKCSDYWIENYSFGKIFWTENNTSYGPNTTIMDLNKCQGICFTYSYLSLGTRHATRSQCNWSWYVCIDYWPTCLWDPTTDFIIILDHDTATEHLDQFVELFHVLYQAYQTSVSWYPT